MARLKLLDTGYVDATTSLASQTQLSDSDRAGYTGSAVTSFTLKNAGVTRNRGVTTEVKPVPDALTNVGTSIISTNNEVYSVSMILSKAITTNGFSTNDIVQFVRMESTRGLKLLYPSDNNEIDGYKNIVQALGASNTGGNFSEASPTDDKGTVSTTTPYLIGRVKNLSITDSTNSIFWSVSFDFEVSG